MFPPLYTILLNLYSFGGNYMKEFMIRFGSCQEVQDFVALSAGKSFPIIVGSDSYHVNGSSFMGMFSLDHSKPQKITVHCSDEEAEQFFQDIQRLLTN